MKVKVLITATGAKPRQTVIEAADMLNGARAVLGSAETDALCEEARAGGGSGMIILVAYPASVSDQQQHVASVTANGSPALLQSS